MTLSNLKKVCAAYLGKATADLTIDSVDMFLIAANNVRRNAELLHDFEYARVTATLDIDGAAGGLLSAAVIQGSFTRWNGIKSITAVERGRSDGSYIPLDFTSYDSAVERERTELELSSDLWPSARYPSDAQYLARGSTSSIVQRNGALYIYPAGPATNPDLSVLISGYAWLDDYVTADLSAITELDFMLEFGSRYMMWAIICELNHIFMRFVPRQEGVLAPPEKAREEAWRDLVMWDEYLVDPAATVSR